jgi:hypothetical protein
VKPIINSVEVHSQLSINRHAVDGPLVSAGSLWLCQSEDHPENNLVKFGYIVDMIVGKSQNPSIFLATLWKLS